MTELILLGNGWHKQEEGFRWTKNDFSIYILDKIIDSIFFFIKCNKVLVDYSLSYSINNWKTLGKINLREGLNIFNVSLDKTSEIKFKSSSFIPSELGPSNDSRVLGVQVIKFVIKHNNNLKDVFINEVKLKYNIK